MSLILEYFRKVKKVFLMENFSDAFNVLKGIGEAKKIPEKKSPDIVFSREALYRYL